MNTTNCDFSPLKQQLSEEIQQITNELQHSVTTLNNENYCLLGNLMNKRKIYQDGISRCFLLFELLFISVYR